MAVIDPTTGDPPPGMGGNAKAFFSAPFSIANMDPVDWFLLTGVLLISYIAWRFVLIHITEAVTK